MSKFALVIALLIATVSSPARADWQFTKWGMTPAQVAKASKGLATLEADGGIAPIPFTSGSFTFTVSFFFGASGKLNTVVVELKSGGNRLLLDALKEKYGNPDEVDGITTIWRTPRDEIDFSAVNGEDSDATVYYRSRANANTNGL